MGDRKTQSQWSLIWQQFKKNKTAVVALIIIVILVSSAIFAPFIANNRPLVYSGKNYFEYKRALLDLRGVIRQLDHHTTDGQLVTGNIEDEFILRLTTQIDGQLNAKYRQQFAPFKAQIEELVTQQPLSMEQFQTIEPLRQDLRRQFRSTQVELTTQTSFPIIHSIGPLAAILITWNLVLLCIPLWGRVLSRWSGNWGAVQWQRCLLLLFCVLPLLAGIIWYTAVPSYVDNADYKAANFAREGKEITNNTDIVYDWCTWPLIPYGFAESHLRAKNTSPMALGKDEIDQQGTIWVKPHFLGTDGQGRDLASRMIWGGQISLAVGIVAVSIYVFIGIIVGSVAGYFRGKVDMIISRLIEVVICFPHFFLIIAIVAFLGPGIFKIMIIIGLTGWTGVARLIRGEFLRLGNQEFVMAGRSLGYSSKRIIFKHVLPNAIAPVLVSATFGIAGAILTESALSFLGLGITIPIPSWGGILSTGRESMNIAPWIIFSPGIAIFITITCYNLVGEALRDASDPRLRGQR
ncbi:MAG: ABC transporter permease subunit [Pirellulaceae bacterium]